MDFLDTTANEDGEFTDQPSYDIVDIRPRKRRRTQPLPDNSDGDDQSGQSEDDIELPSNDYDDFIEVDDELLGNNASKYEHVVHEPEFAEPQDKVFVTQVDQPWSSPTRIRGPRWRKKSPTPSPRPLSVTNIVQRPATSSMPTQGHPHSSSGGLVSRNEVTLDVDDFDDEELDAFMLTETNGLDAIATSALGTPRHRQQSTQSGTMRQTTLFGTQAPQDGALTNKRKNAAYQLSATQKTEPPTHHQINEDAMTTWVYPLNMGKEVRDYQYNIVHKSLYNNILVALPTGLGKTFIAATVMLNWFRWTREAQIIFVAPTKPLVSQQIDACFNIAGIPKSQTTLLTGEINTTIRAEEWQTKRVFFMTPQTLINDLKSGIADPKKIVLIIVDEAHKATGNYAYVEVVKFLRRFNPSFRVIGLTATPGATVEAVQKVIDGLGIARVEIRTEESIDIQRFVHNRRTELEIFDYNTEIETCLDLFGKAVQPVLDKLNSQNALWIKDPNNITLYGLMMARNQWARSEAGRKANPGLKGMVHHCFTPLMTLAHNLELLKYHGIGPFFRKMKTFENEAYGNGKYAKAIVEHEGFKTLMNKINLWMQKDDFVGHPKLTYLKTVVLNHFMDAGEGVGRAEGRPPSDTRIMVFAHFRDSAEEIVRVLNKHQPMIRAHVFVGQSGTAASEGMDQKKQIDIISKFKQGTYNTLVATSIGEEGLDIGEVDLIVCYDCSKSPIRMLQRMGRTGRKRAGNIVLLLMRGKEERDYHSARDNYAKMQAIIESGKEFHFYSDLSPRIVPKAISPTVSRQIVEIPIENTQPGSIEPKKRKGKVAKKPPKKFHMPDGVEQGFAFVGKSGKTSKKKAKPQPVLDQEDASIAELSTILLSAHQEDDLHERYAQVSGSVPEVIKVVRLESQPQKIRSLDRGGMISHSSATRRVVAASFIMLNDDRQWTRPERTDIVNMWTASWMKTRPTPRNKATTLPSPRRVLGMDQADINMSCPPARRSQAAEDTMKEILLPQQGALMEVNENIGTQAGGNEELPDMYELLGATRNVLRASAQAQDSGRSRIRRVISDDDDDDE